MEQKEPAGDWKSVYPVWLRSMHECMCYFEERKCEMVHERQIHVPHVFAERIALFRGPAGDGIFLQGQSPTSDPPASPRLFTQTDKIRISPKVRQTRDIPAVLDTLSSWACGHVCAPMYVDILDQFPPHSGVSYLEFNVSPSGLIPDMTTDCSVFLPSYSVCMPCILVSGSKGHRQYIRLVFC